MTTMLKMTAIIYTHTQLPNNLQSVTLKLGSIEGITLTCCARPPFSFPLKVGLELEQFHRKTVTKQHCKRSRKAGIRAV